MKSVAFRAIKNSNGYVRSAFVGNAAESKFPGAWGMVIAVSLLLLTASVVGLFLLNK
jgi:hypothetical protein